MNPASASSDRSCITSLRQHIRQQVRQRRRALTSLQQAAFAQQAAERVMTNPRLVDAKRVAVFLSFDGELNTQPLIAALWQHQKQVYLPVLHPFCRGHLLFFTLCAGYGTGVESAEDSGTAVGCARRIAG
ncbi:hypothetical protein OS12_21560 [Dickeya oryzae]